MSIVRKLKMSYDIPFKIEAEIMKRLPIKSLARFKSVSKAWKAFILSSEFIADYNAWNSQHCLLVTCVDYNFKESHELIVDDDTFPLRKLSRTIPSSVNLITTKLDMFSSSQGLFCYYGKTKRLGRMAVIWNPSVPKSVDIVVPDEYDAKYNRSVVGFGVCPRTFDPMLVKIAYIKTDETVDPFYNDTSEEDVEVDDDEDDDEDDAEVDAEDDAMRVEVFTLSSGAWKRLSIDLPREAIRCTQDSVDLDGFIYWCAHDQEFTSRCYNMIMSFDMTSEKFTEISLPSSLERADWLSISKRMESLVVLEYLFIAGKIVCDVWMMEGGIKKSFTKLFTIEAPEASIERVLGFRNNGEPIIAMDNNGSDRYKKGVYLYEPNSRHISYAGISAENYIDLAGSCTNTLLLLDQ